MTRALVIGGTAFIGRFMVERLLDRADEVVIMHRGATTPFGDRVDEIHCDRNDPKAVRAALEHEVFDIVFDNVYDWQRGTTAEQVRETALAAVAGPGTLQRYVFMSSVSAYGDGLDHDERDPLAPEHPGDYLRHKAQSELALFALHRDQGIPVTTLRPAFVYGPHNPFDREAFFWDRIVADRPVIVPGDGMRLMQWVHADDVAIAAIRAGTEDVAVGNAYNLGCAPAITQVEFIQTLARAAGREVTIAFVPRDRIEAAGGSLLAPPLYFGVYLDVPPITMRVERVTSELGVRLRPLEDGLRETFRWYEAQRRPQPDFSWEDTLLAAVA